MAKVDNPALDNAYERAPERGSYSGLVNGTRKVAKVTLGVTAAYFGSYAIQAGLDNQIASANKWLREVQGVEPTRYAVVETLAEAPHFERVVMNTHKAIQGDKALLFIQSRSWSAVDLKGKVDDSLLNEDEDLEVDGVVYEVRSDGTQFVFGTKDKNPNRFCNLGDDLTWFWGAAANAAHKNTVAQAGGVEQPGKSS